MTTTLVTPTVHRLRYEPAPGVRATVPADRLIDYRTGDGWKPICDALGAPVPEAPFPHVNTSEEFRAMLHLDEAPPVS